jgi:hypothetical protein
MTSDLARMRISARSADGCVTATVGPTGELCELRIDERLGADLAMAELARDVLEAARLAAIEARSLRMDAASTLLSGPLQHHLAGLHRVNPAESGDQ